MLDLEANEVKSCFKRVSLAKKELKLIVFGYKLRSNFKVTKFSMFLMVEIALFINVISKY